MYQTLRESPNIARISVAGPSLGFRLPNEAARRLGRTLRISLMDVGYCLGCTLKLPNKCESVSV